MNSDEPHFIEAEIDPEYRTWKKNCFFLYDYLMTKSLEWPSLTAQWLPVVTRSEGKDFSVHRIILGTHTSDGKQNHLIIASVQMPNDDILFDESQFDTEREEYGGYGAISGGKIEIDMRINHAGEVNKARCLPQHPFIIATKSPSSSVFVFDFTRHSSTPSSDGKCKPELTLNGHEQEGFGLAWSPFKTGCLISGGFDRRICLWDIRGTTYSSLSLNAHSTYTSHTDKIADVAWHEMHPEIFGSVSDDQSMMIWDARSNSESPPSLVCRHHSKEVNCLAFNPFNPYIVATGSSDSSIGFWDLRNVKNVIHSMKNDEAVFQLQWSPFYETILAASGSSRRINIYDMFNYGTYLSREEAKFGPPELSFSHVGHLSGISEFSWNQNEPLLACSVSEDNCLHIWQPSIDA